MKILSGLLTLSSALLLFGCTKNYNYSEGDRTRIALSSYVEMAPDPRLQDKQIVAGQPLSFFVTTVSALNEVLYNNVNIIADGNGGFTYSDPMYYPTNGSAVDLYAVHPHSLSASLDTPLDFSVQSDQTGESRYLLSDLLYAQKKDVNRTVNKVGMTFSHKLTKFDFTIKAGAGINLAALNMVAVMNMLTETSINLSTGELGAAKGTSEEITALGVRGTTESETEVTGITAVVVPQSFAGGTRLFRIRIGSIDYYYTPRNPIEFEGGTRYHLILTINQAGIILDSFITDWVDGGSITGEGTIE